MPFCGYFKSELIASGWTAPGGRRLLVGPPDNRVFDVGVRCGRGVPELELESRRGGVIGLDELGSLRDDIVESKEVWGSIAGFRHELRVRVEVAAAELEVDRHLAVGADIFAVGIQGQLLAGTHGLTPALVEDARDVAALYGRSADDADIPASRLGDGGGALLVNLQVPARIDIGVVHSHGRVRDVDIDRALLPNGHRL